MGLHYPRASISEPQKHALSSLIDRSPQPLHYPLARTLQRIVALAALACTILLTACGGSEGGDAAPTAAVSPAASTLAMSGFTPATGGAGSSVTVSGSGFTTVQSVRLAGIAATFTVASDTQIRFTVPSGAQSGRIELAAAGRTVLSASDFSVTLVPLVIAVTPTTVLSGARVTLAGGNLDRVVQVRVGTTTLPIASQDAGTLIADVPSTATSGPITLVDRDGAALQQAQRLTVVAPMTLTSFTPASIVTGQTLTLNGTNLNRATSVAFAGGAVANIATRTSATRITVTVPDAAVSGALRIRGNAGDEIVSSAPLTVAPAIRVDANAVYRVAAAGQSVTLPGAGLTEVSGVLVGGLTATVVSRAATQLVFSVPAGMPCGAIALRSSSQPTVAGGSVVVGAGCAAALAGIDFAQALSQPATDARQRLVPGKETWVRAYVVSDQGSVSSPTVRVTGYRGATILGTLPMSGPATLPVSSGATVSDSIRASEAQSFNAELPAAWVASGLSVRVEVDPEQRYGPMTAVDATPNVGSRTHLEIVLVPVVSGSFAPTLPTTAAVLDEVTRRFPIPRSSISVTVRAPYTLTSVSDGLDTQSEWSSALSELLQLRNTENPTNAYRYYFGFVRRAGGGIAGIGYVAGRAGLGWDAAGGWARAMSHELGHNFGRLHAPCGGVASPDASYPYAGGALGGTPLVDSVPTTLDVVSSAGQSDIMGYCSGSWFSDYNYRAMQTHLESQPQASVTALSSAATADDMLLVSGRIGADGVRFDPVLALRGGATATGGEYLLILITRDGRIIEQPIDAALVDHAEPPEQQFSAIVPNPGPLARLELRRGDAAVPLSSVALARTQRAVSANQPLTLDWNEAGGVLELRWNEAAAPYVSVTHVGNGERTALALQRRGGALLIDTSLVRPGGVFEIGLSDGLNTQLVTLNR
jgi:hypothetical protein